MREVITEYDLLNSFFKTHLYLNKEDIRRIMSPEGLYGDKFTSIYYLIECLRFVKPTNLSVLCLHSDGGVKDYMILYKIGEYDLILARMVFFGGLIKGSFQEKTINIRSLKELAEIINEAIQKI